jgi:pimeloyl-ACP methyl ester carboxylesterase
VGRADRARLAAENPDRFSHIAVANTGLPTGDVNMPEVWWRFRAMVRIFRQMRGAQGGEHPTIHGAGHFLQEDAGEELAGYIVRFLEQGAG